MHTPGKWQRNGSHIYGPDTEGRRLIARICYEGTPADDANSDVILAAPDMLAALRLAQTFITEELECREHSMIPISNDDDASYIVSAQAALESVANAIANAEGK